MRTSGGVRARGDKRWNILLVGREDATRIKDHFDKMAGPWERQERDIDEEGKESRPDPVWNPDRRHFLPEADRLAPWRFSDDMPQLRIGQRLAPQHDTHIKDGSACFLALSG